MFLLQLKKDFVNFISFVKKPNDFQLKIPTKRKFSMVFSLLIIEIIFTLIIIYPILILTNKIIPLKNNDFIIPDTLDTLLVTFLLYVIVVPAIEELVLRYPLRYNKLFSKLITPEKWNRIFPFLVYFLATIFGFLHLTNYTNDSWKFYAISPLIISTQLIAGFILSYIRVRLNMFYSLLYHGIWNALFGIVVSFVSLTFNDHYSHSGKNYDIKIQEQLYFHKNKPKTLKLNKTADKIYILEAQQYLLQKISDTIYGKGKYITDEARININFKSEAGVSKEEFRKILQEKYTIDTAVE